MDLDGVTFAGPSLDDEEVLERLAAGHRALLRQLNGFVAFGGGLHLRGACREPGWHSLREAWEGVDALHRLYPAVDPADVPVGQDAFGDQFLLRGGRVWRLVGETGVMQSLGMELGPFLEHACSDPVGFLQLGPLRQFWGEGGRLQPGQLLSVYPPFVARESAQRISLRAGDA